MSIRLIVNADDYGRDDDVSRGIREGHQRGIVSSTTVMMNMPASEANLRLARQESPGLGLGVHLVLTSGTPLLEREYTATLLNENGTFLRPEKLASSLSSIDPTQAMAEWRAQIEKFVRTTGQAPTHLDSHHHSSYYSKELFRNMLELAKEYKCAIRLPTLHSPEEGDLPPSVQESAAGFAAPLLAEFQPRAPQRFIATFYDEQATKPVLMDILQALGEGDSELMCHPGYTSEILLETSVYNRQREQELAILTDPGVKQLIDARDIHLISFADLV